MKPKFVRLQAIAVLLVALVGMGVLGREADLTIGVTISIGAAIWGYFLCRYQWLCSRSESQRSAYRGRKDRVMVTAALLGLAGPLVLAYCGVVSGGLQVITPPIDHGEGVLTTLSVLLIPLSMLVSSGVDWYLIRPFREGVYDLPACQPEQQESDSAMDYARYWIMHRMVSEFLVYAGIVGVISLAVTIAGQSTHSETGKNVLNLIGLVGIVGWSLAELGKLKAALDFVRFPTCALASWVSGRNADGEDISGFVLDVSNDPGVQLIDEPRGHPAADIAKSERGVPLRFRRTIHPIPPPKPICPGKKCEFWIPDCEIGLRRLEAQASVALSDRRTASPPRGSSGR